MRGAHAPTRKSVAANLPSALFNVERYGREVVNNHLPARRRGESLRDHWLRVGLAQRIIPTPRFAEKYYVHCNPDVAADGVFGFEHFLVNGMREGRSPTPWFDPQWYAHTADASARDAPYLHFLTVGAADGLAPCALIAECVAEGLETNFSLTLYDALIEATELCGYFFDEKSLRLLLCLLMQDKTVSRGAGILMRLNAYLRDGFARGHAPGVLFDPNFYVQRAKLALLPIADTDIPLVHWLQYGVECRIVPTPYFDEAFYLAAEPDVAATGAFGFTHFLKFGLREGRRPTPWFDPQWYRAQGSGVNDLPYVHFLSNGAPDGHAPGPLLAAFLARYGVDRLSLALYRELVAATLPWSWSLDQKSLRLLLSLYAPPPSTAVSRTALDGLIIYLKDDVAHGISPGPLFDSDVYVQRAGRAASAPLDDLPPIIHWLAYGAERHIVPTLRFDETFYAATGAGVDEPEGFGFVHFLESGLDEGRLPTPWFDPEWYRERGIVAHERPYVHFLHRGADEGHLPGPLVAELLRRNGDDSFSLALYDELVEATHPWSADIGQEELHLLICLYNSAPQIDSFDPVIRRFSVYLREELGRGRSPGALFDAATYIAQAGLAAIRDFGSDVPLVHWLRYGVAQRSVPTPYFDEAFYLMAYPDVAVCGGFGFVHFLEYGLREGRRPTPWFDPRWYREQTGLVDQTPYLHFLAVGCGAGLAPGPQVMRLITLEGAPDFSLEVYGDLVAAMAPWNASITPESLELLVCLFGVGSPSSTIVAPVRQFLSYVRDELARGVSPGPLFEREVYTARASRAFLPPLGADAPVIHWLRYGVAKRIVPTVRFDEMFYLACDPIVAASAHFGFAHFIVHGLREGRRPTPWFDPGWYRERLDSSKEIPYAHFLSRGADERRLPGPLVADSWPLLATRHSRSHATTNLRQQRRHGRRTLKGSLWTYCSGFIVRSGTTRYKVMR